MKNRSCVLACLACLLSALFPAAGEEDLRVDGKPVAELVKQLTDMNRGLQVRAARALSEAPAGIRPALMPRIVPLLRSERENDRFVAAQVLGNDTYAIAFAVQAACDATVAIVDPAGGVAGSAFGGRVVRHLASGVLGAHAPAPYEKNSLRQTIHWNGKDDLGEYVREPGRLHVRVPLGLKPEFDRAPRIASPSRGR
jgi:hypothetical protein